MAILYLDVDDEITSAASRMRAADESRVVLVLPAGSRLGTSRINFRLLAREAATNGRSLSIVSPEAATRALAASAGLPVFASVFEYEAATASAAEAAAAASAVQAAGATGGEAGRSGAAVSGATAGPGDEAGRPRGAAALAATTAAGVAAGPVGAGGVASAGSSAGPSVGVRDGAGAGAPGAGSGAGTGTPGRGDATPGAERGNAEAGAPRPGTPRRARGPLVVALVVLVLAVGVAAVLGYVFLPTASVEVVVRPQPLGPMETTVTADPAVSAPDAAASVVPAQRPTIDLAASGTYPATGKKVTETSATGSVRWQNCDPTSAYTIPRGTVVRTRAGIAFATDEAVFVPVAVLAGNPPSITCQTRDVGVTATTAGEAGNVGAGTITVVPASYNSVVVRVANPAPTSGGTHTETKLVSQKDVDAARKALTAKLDAQLAAALADTGKLAATGQAFPDTAARTSPTFDPDPAGLVGQEIDGFDLSASATGSVTVVDESSVAKMAEQALVASVPAGQQLVPGSTRVDLGEPTVEGQAVRYPVTAAALVVTPVDPAQVRAAVAGRPLEEARQAAARYGDATITLWPSWVSTVPTYDFRLDVKVVTEAPAGTAGASPAPGSTSPAAPGAPSGLRATVAPATSSAP